MEEIEKLEVGGLTITIYRDPDPEYPRNDGGFGAIVDFAHCKSHQLGAYNRYSNDCRMDVEDVDTIVRGIWNICLPVYLYDHSGIAVSTGKGHFSMADSRGWDWGMQGIIYMPLEKGMKEWDKEWNLADMADMETRLRSVLTGEIETLDQYFHGDIYGYVITDEDGDEVDSCWGFYGDTLEEGEAYHPVDSLGTVRAEALGIAEGINDRRPAPAKAWAPVIAANIAARFPELNGDMSKVINALADALAASPDDCKELIGTVLAPKEALAGWTPS